MGTLDKKLFVIAVILSLTVLPGCDLSQTNMNTNEPNLERFSKNEAFQNLVETTKKIIEIQSKHFQKIPEAKKTRYTGKLNDLTELLKDNPSEENLKKFVHHAGFNSLNQFMNLYKRQKKAKKYLNERFSGYENLSIDKKSIFLKKAARNLDGNNILKGNVNVTSSSACAYEYEQKIRSIESSAYLEVLACGAAGVGATSMFGPIGGGALYGVCVGAAYSRRDAKLEVAYIEYKRCLEDQ